MKNVYLVQRLQKPVKFNNPFSFGGGLANGGLSEEAMSLLKNIFSFDYMGSAEFEWGAVPTAIKELFTNNPIAFTIVRKDKEIYVICFSSIQDDVIEWINLAARGKQPGVLKEYLGLQDSLIGKGNNLGWLKVEGDKRCEEPFMFFTDKEMFEGVCKLFELTPL